MKYYKHNSIPLEETIPNIGDQVFDEFGNYISFQGQDVFGDPHLIVLNKSVLKEGEVISQYENMKFLKAFWSMTNKSIKGDEIYDSVE